MPWPIKFHETQPRQPRAGDCWPDPELIEGENRDHMRNFFLSPEYFRDHYDRKERAPLWVVLPDKTYFCVDSRVTAEGERGDHGWTVTGNPVEGTLTVSPSINIVGSYHGYIQNNVITDDVEGRRFPHADLPDAPVEEGAPAQPPAEPEPRPFWTGPDLAPFWKVKK